MTHLIVFLAAYLLDALLGDPAWLPHPVVAMGRAITGLEHLLRRLFSSTNTGLLAAGCVLAALLPVGSFCVAAGALLLAGRVHPLLALALNAFWGGQCLAVRDLRKEAMAVYACLKQNDLPAARKAVGRIVGRDTAALTAEGVTKAAVETVAENFSDGVFAPMFYLAIGGAPLALAYKAVNTMDSMVGYKNDRYLYFGRAAAHLDDVANWLPARLSGLLLILAAPLCGLSGKEAFRIWRRDRRSHASPNSAQTEAACAGALRVQLAGDAFYFGKPVHKPTLGDPLRPVEAEDIPRACRLMTTGSLLGLILLAGLLAGRLLCL